MLDRVDRQIINELQGGFPVCDRPFEVIADKFELSEQQLIDRICRLKEEGILSRFGPMYNADRMGGAFCLCAMEVPESLFERVVEQVNAHPEVAHNYEREHRLNMWFVLATETKERIISIATEIECETGLRVYRMPKLEEYFVGLKVQL